VKILILQGSPTNGHTKALCASFIESLADCHEVKQVDVAKKNIHGCLGCDMCKQTPNVCVQQDDMIGLLQKISGAECLVFASPIYFAGITSQLKAVLDRCHCLEKDRMQNKKTVLLFTSGSVDETVIAPALAMFDKLQEHFHWTMLGLVHAPGVHRASDVLNVSVLAKAQALGQSL